jgi:hypothetical protein
MAKGCKTGEFEAEERAKTGGMATEYRRSQIDAQKVNTEGTGLFQ